MRETGERTQIYYYSSTGNSLYVARFLEKSLPNAEIFSIPEELSKDSISIKAGCVGFVFPMHYFGLPLQVEEFMERITIYDAQYIFAIATCGVPYWGRPFMDAEAILAMKHLHINACWYVRLVSNYLPYRDTAADWRIRIRAWLAERKLRRICHSLKDEQDHGTWQILKGFCQQYHEEWKNRRQKIDEAFICDREKCTSCGICERICPVNNIRRPEGFPVWQHQCVECLGCLHACPTEAIDYGDITKGHHRYRHKDITITDLLQSWRRS